jgi:hypothetical protein
MPKWIEWTDVIDGTFISLGVECIQLVLTWRRVVEHTSHLHREAVSPRGRDSAAGRKGKSREWLIPLAPVAAQNL